MFLVLLIVLLSVFFVNSYRDFILFIYSGLGFILRFPMGMIYYFFSMEGFCTV